MDSDDITAVIAGYQPAAVDAATWATVAPAVRQWVTAAAPGHRRRALQLLYTGAHLAAWCAAQHIDVAAGTALRTTTIERFCAAAERDGRISPTTRATLRSRLRCLAAHQTVPG